MPLNEDLLETWRFAVEPEDEGTRLDHFLRDQDVGVTRSQLKKLIESGHVFVGGVDGKPSQKLRDGQEIVLRIPPPEPLEALPEEMSLDIRYEDEFLVVVNKAQGVVVHPAPGHPRGTLINGILFGRTARGGDPLRPGIVHRLDKDTSGLLVVAKTDAAHAGLARQFHDHTVERRYRVIVAGEPPDSGEWRTLHGRHPTDRRLFSSRVRRGKPAVSRFTVSERFPGAALLLVTLLTGRTHQVRVHCRDHGFPVLGDPLYGPGKLPPYLLAVHKGLPGQALHAERLGFDHPISGERLVFAAAPPEAFCDAVSLLRKTE